MNQNQRVPSWDLDDVSPIQPPPPPPAPPRAITSRSHSTSLSTGHDTSLLDYEVAELTWENGQLTMHGLGFPRVWSKSNSDGAWTEKPFTRASGTLESIVNQAITKPQPATTFQGGACEKDAGLVPCFDTCGCSVGGGAASGPATSVSMTMDALVPTANVSHNTRVGSCSAAARVPVGSEWSVSVSASESTRKREKMKGPTGETCEIVGGELTKGLTSTSFETSPENTKTVAVDDIDDHDSVCHSRPQKERREKEEIQNKASGKSSMSTKRSRAAAIHNQSERKRRDKINQRMKTLQKLVPNSSKTDKASMLDEVIDYLKQLQAQVQMMSRMSMPASMMMPMAAIQQQLQMSMMSQMGMAGMGMGIPGMGMGMGMSMDHINMGINPMAVARPNGAGGAPILNPSTFMPSLATWDATATATTTASTTSGGADRLSSQHQQQQAMVPTDPYSAAFLAYQSQPMTMDTYSRMAAMYQQLQQQLQQPYPRP